MVRYLLERDANPGVAKVETFDEVGAQGYYWPPTGLKVTFSDGTAVFLSVNKTSAPEGDPEDDTEPNEFRLEDLHVPSLRSENVSQARQ
jgi:hypothetical protein